MFWYQETSASFAREKDLHFCPEALAKATNATSEDSNGPLELNETLNLFIDQWFGHFWSSSLLESAVINKNQ